MKRLFTLFCSLAAAGAISAETGLTIYNANLAVVREHVPLDLQAGESQVVFDRATAQVVPDSVVLRDPKGETEFAILEQGYRNDPVSKWLLLKHFEGKEITFRRTFENGEYAELAGKIIRSGFEPGGHNTDPIIEVDGKLHFSLPGEPLFPSLGDDSILRPTLSWIIAAQGEAQVEGQLSYLSRGFNWEADYNMVVPEKGGAATLTGWVTLTNNSGATFPEAKVKLIAGEVSVIEEQAHFRAKNMMLRNNVMETAAAPGVEEKAFDDFHLYTLPRVMELRDKETKQVEFLRSPKVQARKEYIYDPFAWRRFTGGEPRTQPIQGEEAPKAVNAYWLFTNNEDNGLSLPLPAGRVRIYREDSEDGNLEFVGENNIGHTPREEEVKLFSGNAFDLVGERKVTDFKVDSRAKWMRESIEITLKNRAKEPRTILAREHLWRWFNWEIEKKDADFIKKDVNTIEFATPLEPNEEKKISYTVKYSW